MAQFTTQTVTVTTQPGGMRDWNSGLFACMDDMKTCEYLKSSYVAAKSPFRNSPQNKSKLRSADLNLS